MSSRWKKWAAAAAGVFAAYAALGFWAVPWAIERGLSSYALDKLERRAAVGRLAFNPFTLRLEAVDLRLEEAGREPIFSVERLAVELKWRSLVTGAWRFAEIAFTTPTAWLAISPEGRFNLEELVRAATRGSQPSNDPSLPRIAIDRFSIAGGRVDMQDRRAGYANTLAPIDFEVTDFSTLPGHTDSHQFVARSKSGGVLRWKGQASVNPIRAEGEFVLENASLPELSVYMKSKVRAAIAAGKLTVAVPYAVSYADGKLQAAVKGARFAAQDLAVAREGATDSFASLTQLAGDGIDADLVKLDFSVKELRAEQGRFTLRRDAKGELDVAKLMIESAGPAAPAPDWKLAVGKVVADRLAVSVVDETIDPPLKIDLAGAGAQLALQAGQQGERFDLKVSDAMLALNDLSAARGAQPPLKLARAGFEGGTLDLAARTAALARVHAEGAQLAVVRDKQGGIDLAGWVPAAGPASPAAQPASAPWAATIGTLQIAKVNVDLRDEGSGIQLKVVDAHAKLDGAGTDLKRPVRFNAGLALAEGGQIATDGSVVPARGALQARVKASRISLKPLQPLLAQYVKLRIGDGALSAQGKVATGAGTRDQPALRYDGDFEVAALSIREEGGDAFASWRTFGAEQLTASVSPNRLEIPELRLAGADAKLIIEEDRSFNAARFLVKRDAPPAAPAAAPAADDAEPFPVRIRRVRIQDAKLDFTDLSLRPQFAAKIQDLNGVVNGLSTSRTARAQIELDGRVDEFGLSRIRGETSLAAPRDSTDVHFVFRNVDMVPASTYSMKFAGYRIAEGRISLDLQYKIRDRKLEGDNKIVIDKLTLGERVESPDALKIPLSLAIAILKDSDGRIDLGLPVSGDLDDPQFSYGAIIWKAIGNVLTKIVTAPFRALGAMLGVDADKLEAIAFDPGSGKLLPPEKEKLKQVAQILAKREGLKLSVAGPYDAAADGAALRAQAVRRQVGLKAGIKLAPGEEPGPLDFGDRQIRTALREVYEQRFGDAELSKARKAAESAPAASGAPAPLPVWQRVGKFVQGEPQVADSSAFYRQLRDRLEREEPLPADAMSQLGSQRAKAIVAALVESGVPAARISTGAAAAADGVTGATVPAKLALEAR
jgi:hypothetical protein